MIQRDFRDTEGAKSVGFSHGDFGFVVQTLDDAAGELLASLQILPTVCCRCIAEVQARIAPTHSERQLSIFEGSWRLAAPDFLHRPLWAHC